MCGGCVPNDCRRLTAPNSQMATPHGCNAWQCRSLTAGLNIRDNQIHSDGKWNVRIGWRAICRPSMARPGRDQAGALNLVSNAMNAMADAPGRHRSARNFLELGTFEEFPSANLPVAS